MSDLAERVHDRRVCSPAQNYCYNNPLIDEMQARIEQLEREKAEAVEMLEDVAAEVDDPDGAGSLPCDILDRVKAFLSRIEGAA